jgi:hypothetical protein
MLVDEDMAAGTWSTSSMDSALLIFLPSIDSSALAALIQDRFSNAQFTYSLTKK